MKILFLFPYPEGQAASQRFRFEQYLSILKEHEIEFELSPFLSESSWSIFYKQGYWLKKAFALLLGFIKRVVLLFRVGRFDYVFIHREVLPVGPPVFEWCIGSVLGKKIIYDFDDAIWIANSSESNKFFSPLKFHDGVFKICRWSYKVSAGNRYLANAVLPYNAHVVINPTTIDTVLLHNRLADHTNEIPVIGWTGSHSTNKYLDPMYEIIRKLKEKHHFRFVIISDESPEKNTDLFEFIKWNKLSEIDDLRQFNVGIMPLTYDAWSEGKCGFKALQYMALGIPALVSPVGINEEIVDHAENGFICHSEEDWFRYLSHLLDNRDEVKKLGFEARKKIQKKYSVTSNTSNFIHLFT